MEINRQRRNITLLLFSLPILPALTTLQFIQNLSGTRIVNKGGWLLSESDR